MPHFNAEKSKLGHHRQIEIDHNRIACLDRLCLLTRLRCPVADPTRSRCGDFAE